MKKAICMFICMAMLCTFVPISLASNLEFNHAKYDSLTFSYKDLYEIVTSGITDIPIGSTKEQIISKMGPDFTYSKDGREYLFCFDQTDFRMITYILKDNSLQSIIFTDPLSKPIQKMKTPDIIKIFGEPEEKHASNKRLVYKDQNSTVQFIWKKAFWMKSFSSLTIGDVSKKDIISWGKVAMGKALPAYINYSFEKEMNK